LPTGGFNYRLADLPATIRDQFAELGPQRRRSYARLLQEIRALAPAVFEVVGLGTCEDCELVKLWTRRRVHAMRRRCPLAWWPGARR